MIRLQKILLFLVPLPLILFFLAADHWVPAYTARVTPAIWVCAGIFGAALSAWGCWLLVPRDKGMRRVWVAALFLCLATVPLFLKFFTELDVLLPALLHQTHKEALLVTDLQKTYSSRHAFTGGRLTVQRQGQALSFSTNRYSYYLVDGVGVVQAEMGQSAVSGNYFITRFYVPPAAEEAAGREMAGKRGVQILTVVLMLGWYVLATWMYWRRQSRFTPRDTPMA